MVVLFICSFCNIISCGKKFVAATNSFPSEAAGECGYNAEAKASDAGFAVCKHEGAKNESSVDAE